MDIKLDKWKIHEDCGTGMAHMTGIAQIDGKCTYHITEAIEKLCEVGGYMYTKNNKYTLGKEFKMDMKIVNWSVYTKPHRPGKEYVMGDIYNDERGKFTDGSRLYTSSIVSLDEEAGILKTQNSTYKLENKRK